MVVGFVLPQPFSGGLFEGEGGALFEPINEGQTIRSFVLAVNQQMQMVGHEAVRCNVETLLLGLRSQQAEVLSYQDCVLKPRNTILGASGEEVPLTTKVRRARETYVFSPEIHGVLAAERS